MIGSRWREIRRRGERDGWGFVLGRMLRVLGYRLFPPWITLYWVATAETSAPAAASVGDHLRLVETRDLDQLERRDRSVVLTTLPEFALVRLQERLREGCILHLLFVEDQLAGERFVVCGSRCAFHHIPLTEHDAIDLDLRIEPAFRGRGLGTQFLRLSNARLADASVERIYTGVNVRNEASNRAVRRAGFRSLLRYKRRLGFYRFDRKPVR